MPGKESKFRKSLVSWVVRLEYTLFIKIFENTLGFTLIWLALDKMLKNETQKSKKNLFICLPPILQVWELTISADLDHVALHLILLNCLCDPTVYVLLSRDVRTSIGDSLRRTTPHRGAAVEPATVVSSCSE